MNLIESELYTEKEWDKEWAALLAEPCHHSMLGSCWMPCPNCNSVGFYSLRVIQNQAGEITRKYRACKFCGFWQETSGDVFKEKRGQSYRCIAIYCDKCGTYDWRVPWVKQLGNCSNCGNADVKKIKWASDDSNHPFNKAREQIAEIHNK